jgi:hypothetical protein
VTEPAASPDPASTRPLAVLVATALGAVLLLIVVTLAFSTSNTPASVDGTNVTYSHYLDVEE